MYITTTNNNNNSINDNNNNNDPTENNNICTPEFHTPPPPGSDFSDCECARIETKASITCIYIYIYIYTHTRHDVYIYIYIHIHTHTTPSAGHGAGRDPYSRIRDAPCVGERGCAPKRGRHSTIFVSTVQWQPDSLTIHTNKWFLGAGFLGASPISLSMCCDVAASGSTVVPRRPTRCGIMQDDRRTPTYACVIWTSLRSFTGRSPCAQCSAGAS